MWKAVVQVCFLLSTTKELTGVEGGKKSQSAVRNNSLADKLCNQPNTPASSSPYLGNLLVIPMDGSHWVDLKAVCQAMGRRGHKVTVLIPKVSLRLGPGEYYTTVIYPVPYGQAEVDALLGGNAEAMNKPFMEKMERIAHMSSVIHETAKSLLFNTTLMTYLAQQGFDAVLTNPMLPTGTLIARKLGLPTINLLRGMPCGMDMKTSASPSPPSYVPRFYTGFTDKMNFKQRLLNTLISFLEPLMCKAMYWNFDKLAVEFLGEQTTIADILRDSAIWLIRTDFTLDHPRPLMPNVVLVGGMNCDLRNPLPEDLETWVSGPDGFLVFTLGAMVASLPLEITLVFLEAFRKIPQKVVWRWVGPVPDNVPENVKMMKWVPQNDLLAHPGVRAFITHAGSHGLYEGVCHAVPMMMLPISAEQPDNAQRMASRGVGVVLDIQTVTVEQLLKGLSDIMHNTRYKKNIETLSSLHKDRPIASFDLSLYWIEFVMRHKGAEHLKTAAHKLNWFQYHSLDVLALLSVVAMVGLTVTLTCMRWCLGKILSKRKKD